MEMIFSPGNEGGLHLDRRRPLFRRAEHVVTPGRLELPTNSLGNCCSIHLSYGATFITAPTGSVYRKVGKGSACLRYDRLKNIPKKGHPHRDLSTRYASVEMTKGMVVMARRQGFGKYKPRIFGPQQA
jgi:hypothetical protein